MYGSALVLTLLMLVLLSGVIIAYFSRTLINRQISFSSASQDRADVVAKDALQIVIGDVRSEMENGSICNVSTSANNTVAGTLIMDPLAPQTMVPSKPVTTAGVPLTFTSMNNLVKWSAGGAQLWPATSNYTAGGPVRAATGNLTTTPSANGRYVDLSRWNAPQMTFLTSASTSPIPQWPPSWVVLTRSGALQVPTSGTITSTQLTSLANSAATNTSYAVGRFAYAVYDEGALLDVAAAGYPSGTATSSTSRKGILGYADLTQLPPITLPSGATATPLSQSQVDALVAWRNAASSTNYTSYLSDFASRTGFLQAASGDSAFVSRQDLINYCVTNLGAAQAAQVLPYLTTFSRENNAPSWGPLADAAAPSAAPSPMPSPVPPNLGGSNSGYNSAAGTGTSVANLYAYRDNAISYFQNPSTALPNGPNGTYVTNPFIPGIRVANAFTRLDGTQAVVGEPLVKNRFDLSKLSWITHTGTLPTNINASDVMSYFGLQYDSTTSDTTCGAWIYCSHAPGSASAPATRILTLPEVAALNREPDFFELLQAGILQGSLGSLWGDPTQASDEWAGGEYWGGGWFGDAAANSAGFAWGAPDFRWQETSLPGALLVYPQEKYHIIQIGANLIDQVQPDSFPTEIVLNGQSFYGAQNLPYINAFGDAMLRPTPGTSNPALKDTNSGYVHRWLTFSLWNPNQNAATPSTTGPTKLRIYCEDGEVASLAFAQPGYLQPPDTQWPPNLSSQGVHFSHTTSSAPFENVGPAWIGLNYPDTTNYPGNFADPTTLTYAGTVTAPTFDPTSGTNINDPAGRQQTADAAQWSRAGLYLGYSLTLDVVDVPDNAKFQPSAPSTPASTTSNPPAAAGAIFYEPTAQPVYFPPDETPHYYTYNAHGRLFYTAPLQIHLQYYDSNVNRWRDYQVLHRFAYDTDDYNVPWLASGQTSLTEGWQMNLPDPRSTRMNFYFPNGSPGHTSTGVVMNHSFYNLSVTEGYNNYNPPKTPPFNAQYVADWVFNDASANNHYYLDRDGVDRLGDSGHWTTSDNPLQATKTTARPVILNRPFQSVAEMGYTFRDQPWKSLNLYSWNASTSNTAAQGNNSSADSALLDLFCVGSTSAGKLPPPAMVAGKVEINNASAPVLQALIAGANRNAQTSSSATVTGITSADASTLATAIATSVATAPLQNLSQVPATFPQTGGTSSTANPNYKIQREAMVRALMGSTSTRTWNLLIDVIAQSGRYRSSPSSMNDFVVEGEKHYWLHVAIDRYTGKVIDQVLEPVFQ